MHKVKELSMSACFMIVASQMLLFDFFFTFFIEMSFLNKNNVSMHSFCFLQKKSSNEQSCVSQFYLV